MMEHILAPVTAQKNGDFSSIIDSRGFWAADFLQENEAADAARAINAHDALVEAVKELLPLAFAFYEQSVGTESAINEPIIKRAEAALKLAKGGE